MININYVTLSDYVRYVDASSAHQVQLLLVYSMNKLAMMSLVSWWLVLVQTGTQNGNSVLLPEYIYFHQLPSMMPYMMVQLLWMLTTGIHMETPRVSLMDCHDYWWRKFHVCQEIESCRHTCLIQAFPLQQPQLWPGALWRIWFFPFNFPPSAAPRKL